QELFHHLKLATKLHNIREIVLTAHDDCGAGVTRRDLVSALQQVRRSYPEHDITAFWVSLDGTWQQID
ncbi:MAG: hypothetical protein O3A46_11670, partial [Candidatus Poribacteria bacterium]|nr:hypothetical protein [Candidatus Poribacteria bacterium]